MGAVIVAMLFISIYLAIGIVFTWFVVQFITGDEYKSEVYIISVLIWPVIAFTVLLAFIVGLVLRAIGKNKKS